MSMLGPTDKETRSYLEIVDAPRQHRAAPQADMEALWRERGIDSKKAASLGISGAPGPQTRPG